MTDNVEDVESEEVPNENVGITKLSGSTELVTQQSGLSTSNEFDESATNRIQLLIDSKALPATVKTVAHAYAYIKFGQELGFQWMQSFNYLTMISGRLGLNANGMQALALKAGIQMQVIHDAGYYYEDGKIEELPREKIDPKTDKPEKIIDRVTTVIFKRSGYPDQRVTFTLRDAKKAELYDKPGDMWKKYLRNMLYAAVERIGLRRIANDIMGGLYTAEELADMGADEKTIIRNNEGMVIGQRID